MADEKEIDRALRFDGINEAEKVTGKSYKEDEYTSLLGLGLVMSNGEYREKILQESGDTHFGVTIPRLIEILGEEGFVQIMDIEIPLRDAGQKVNDRFRVFWNEEEAILVNFDSYGGDKIINGGTAYLNHHLDDDEERFNAYEHCANGAHLSEDRSTILSWEVSFDIRVGFRHRLGKIRRAGRPAKPWTRQPFLWLLHYRDTEDKRYDHKAITEERIGRFPRHVIDTIKGVK